jgi:hypothetical protein
MGGMLYLKARIAPPWPEWGDTTRYLEIGDDLYATRHLDLYDNGNALRYDRENCRCEIRCQEVGEMVGAGRENHCERF